MNMTYTVGQKVIYTRPTNKRIPDPTLDRPAVVTKEYPNRVEVLIEVKPGQHIKRMVSKERVRAEE